MKAIKKYYVLYKTIRNNNGDIIDALNIPNTNNEDGNFYNYNDVMLYLSCYYRDVKKMINKNIDKLEDIKTYKNYFIIKDLEN